MVGNWCGYTTKSGRKIEVPKNQQTWIQSYWIDRKPYGGTGFNKVGAPTLPPYNQNS